MTEGLGQLVPLEASEREESRHAVWIARAQVREHDGEGSEVRLRDLSTTGCRMTTPAEYTQGQRIWLRFQAGPVVAATVIWCEDGQAGCAFDTAIPHAFVRALTLKNF